MVSYIRSMQGKEGYVHSHCCHSMAFYSELFHSSLDSNKQKKIQNYWWHLALLLSKGKQNSKKKNIQRNKKPRKHCWIIDQVKKKMRLHCYSVLLNNCCLINFLDKGTFPPRIPVYVLTIQSETYQGFLNCYWNCPRHWAFSG